MHLDAEDAANYAILRDSVQNVMNQPWSGVFPDLNGDPNAVDTYTVDETTDAIWALMKQHNSNYKDVTSNWDQISKHILAAREQSKDEKEQENTKEEGGTGSAAAVEKAAADGKVQAAGSQEDGAAAPGAAAPEAVAADNMHLHDAAFATPGGQAAVPNAGTEGQAETAGRGDVQPAQDQHKAEREHTARCCARSSCSRRRSSR